jgi:hypothetical protein
MDTFNSYSATQRPGAGKTAHKKAAAGAGAAALGAGAATTGAAAGVGEAAVGVGGGGVGGDGGGGGGGGSPGHTISVTGAHSPTSSDA